MRFIALALISVFALSIAGQSYAAEGNRFAKGTKSYQKSAPAEVEPVQAEDTATADDQTYTENPQDIDPAAGDVQDAEPVTKEILAEDMHLPRK